MTDYRQLSNSLIKKHQKKKRKTATIWLQYLWECAGEQCTKTESQPTGQLERPDPRHPRHPQVQLGFTPALLLLVPEVQCCPQDTAVCCTDPSKLRGAGHITQGCPARCITPPWPLE